MSFKTALLVPTETHINNDEWSDFEAAYQKYLNATKDKEDVHSLASYNTTLSDSRYLLNEILACDFDRFKTYWEQFGFMNTATVDGLVDSIVSHVQFKKINEDITHFDMANNDEEDAA